MLLKKLFCYSNYEKSLKREKLIQKYKKVTLKCEISILTNFPLIILQTKEKIVYLTKLI